MSKRSVYTEISPLPANISREVVLDFLHSHTEMIDLNPLVQERHPIAPPADAPPSEAAQCTWYSLTDKISYLPGGMATGDVSYTAAFHDLPNGIMTHCRAPLGVDIRSRWTLNGSLPGEAPERAEIGINAPTTGLYIREDVDLRCNLLMASFVKKTTKKAHATLLDRLASKARAVADLSVSGNVTTATAPRPHTLAPSSGGSAWARLRGSSFGGSPSQGPFEEYARRYNQELSPPSSTPAGTNPGEFKPYVQSHSKNNSDPGSISSGRIMRRTMGPSPRAPSWQHGYPSPPSSQRSSLSPEPSPAPHQPPRNKLSPDPVMNMQQRFSMYQNMTPQSSPQASPQASPFLQQQQQQQQQEQQSQYLSPQAQPVRSTFTPPSQPSYQPPPPPPAYTAPAPYNAYSKMGDNTPPSPRSIDSFSLGDDGAIEPTTRLYPNPLRIRKSSHSSSCSDNTANYLSPVVSSVSSSAASLAPVSSTSSSSTIAPAGHHRSPLISVSLMYPEMNPYADDAEFQFDSDSDNDGDSVRAAGSTSSGASTAGTSISSAAGFAGAGPDYTIDHRKAEFSPTSAYGDDDAAIGGLFSSLSFEPLNLAPLSLPPLSLTPGNPSLLAELPGHDDDHINVISAPEPVVTEPEPKPVAPITPQTALRSHPAALMPGGGRARGVSAPVQASFRDGCLFPPALVIGQAH